MTSAPSRASTRMSASATSSRSFPRSQAVAMRDEQVRRYSRHIRLQDVGGLGQTALMVSSAKLVLRESEPRAELIAASYLVAGGVGTLVLSASSDEQRAAAASHAPDTKVVSDGDGG